MLRTLAFTSAVLLFASCAGVGILSAHQDEEISAQAGSSIIDAGECAEAVHRDETSGIAAVMPDAIRLLNWNIQKNKKIDLQSDMQRLAQGADLVLLQEATHDIAQAAQLNDGYHDAFAPGYRSSTAQTGVMTVSKAPPITRCSFRYQEPWLRTPKATNVTEYALGDRHETLLVVNMHMVNFTFGLGDLRRQLDEAVRVIEGHEGPVIVSGDFNTWSQLRGRAVGEALDRLGLDPIGFRFDLRKRVFGNALDHVWLRGGDVVASTSHGVESSDHNPMEVVLELWADDVPRGDDEFDSY